MRRFIKRHSEELTRFALRLKEKKVAKFNIDVHQTYKAKKEYDRQVENLHEFYSVEASKQADCLGTYELSSQELHYIKMLSELNNLTPMKRQDYYRYLSLKEATPLMIKLEDILSKANASAKGSEILSKATASAKGSEILSKANASAKGSEVLSKATASAKGSEILSKATASAKGSEVLSKANASAKGSEILSKANASAKGSEVLSKATASAKGSKILSKANASAKEILSNSEAFYMEVLRFMVNNRLIFEAKALIISRKLNCKLYEGIVNFYLRNFQKSYICLSSIKSKHPELAFKYIFEILLLTDSKYTFVMEYKVFSRLITKPSDELTRKVCRLLERFNMRMPLREFIRKNYSLCNEETQQMMKEMYDKESVKIKTRFRRSRGWNFLDTKKIAVEILKQTKRGLKKTRMRKYFTVIRKIKRFPTAPEIISRVLENKCELISAFIKG
jgi:hypothetical protein